MDALATNLASMVVTEGGEGDEPRTNVGKNSQNYMFYWPMYSGYFKEKTQRLV